MMVAILGDEDGHDLSRRREVNDGIDAGKFHAIPC